MSCIFDDAAITPAPEPTLPPELALLPKSAYSLCSHDAHFNRGTIYLWELPGTEPSDPDSIHMGSRGKMLGEMPRCEKIVILRYAWSGYDKLYWVYIEWEDVQGWVHLDLIQFKP